ncbi:MAG TPA: hypothetical protein VN698_09990 [Bacteroidia bacterium]|nr:hypothetical protein [Bacteroidia bacterium]
MAAAGLGTIEINCSSELEARKIASLISLKDAVKAEDTAGGAGGAARPEAQAWFSGLIYNEDTVFDQSKPET